VPLHEWVEGRLVSLAAAGGVPWATATAGMQHRDAELEGMLAREPLERGNKGVPITWLFEPDSLAPLGRVCDGEPRSIVCDHLGTPALMAEGDGDCPWSLSIGVYGALRNVKGDRVACPFRWPGQYEDLETGLHYNRFRYYDPESGLYVSQDPIGLAGSANLYAYVSDPLASTDPFGLTESRGACSGELGPDTLVNRVGGAHVQNLRLKPQEQALSPPGISVLLGTSAKDAAQQMKNAFPKATGLHEQARTVGGSSIARVRRAGFDVLADPTKKFPNHARLVHPDGTSGFSDENLRKLFDEFTNVEGLR